MLIKWNQEIRANETFSFIENEITTKYVQMKFIFGEQIYFKDIGPLGLQIKNTLWWLMKGPHFLCRYCDVSVVNCMNANIQKKKKKTEQVERECSSSA